MMYMHVLPGIFEHDSVKTGDRRILVFYKILAQTDHTRTSKSSLSNRSGKVKIKSNHRLVARKLHRCI